jgi:hypothetical protein
LLSNTNTSGRFLFNIPISFLLKHTMLFPAASAAREKVWSPFAVRIYLTSPSPDDPQKDSPNILGICVRVGDRQK